MSLQNILMFRNKVAIYHFASFTLISYAEALDDIKSRELFVYSYEQEFSLLLGNVHILFCYPSSRSSNEPSLYLQQTVLKKKKEERKYIIPYLSLRYRIWLVSTFQ